MKKVKTRNLPKRSEVEMKAIVQKHVTSCFDKKTLSDFVDALNEAPECTAIVNGEYLFIEFKFVKEGKVFQFSVTLEDVFTVLKIA